MPIPVSIFSTMPPLQTLTGICRQKPSHRRGKLNTAPLSGRSRLVICIFLSLFLTGCSVTSTPSANQQCVPLPASLTQPVLAPLPPAD